MSHTNKVKITNSVFTELSSDQNSVILWVLSTNLNNHDNNIISIMNSKFSKISTGIGLIFFNFTKSNCSIQNI